MDTLELTLFDVESKSSQIWSKLRRNVRALVHLKMCGAAQYKPNRSKSTSRTFDRGGVFVKACPMYVDRTRTRMLQQSSSQRVGALSLIPSCLGISGHPSGSRQGHPRYTGARSAGRPLVARTQFSTAVQCRNTPNIFQYMFFFGLFSSKCFLQLFSFVHCYVAFCNFFHTFHFFSLLFFFLQFLVIFVFHVAAKRGDLALG